MKKDIIPRDEIEQLNGADEITININNKNKEVKITAVTEDGNKRKVINKTITNSITFGNFSEVSSCKQAKDYDEEVITLYESGMKQNDISKNCGISQATVSRILKKSGYARGKKKKDINKIEINGFELIIKEK